MRVTERGFPAGDDVGAQAKADADSLGRCFPDIPVMDISLPLAAAAARRGGRGRALRRRKEKDSRRRERVSA